MYKSKLEDKKGIETDLAFNTRIAFCMFKAEHVGEKTTIPQFIEWCDEQIKKGPFILEKPPNKNSVKKWRKRWSHDESAIAYIINEIKNRLSTADDKYKISILELIIEDLKFIKDLYDEKENLEKRMFTHLKDYFLTIKHIDENIWIIEKRVRVRLGLATSYNDNLNKHELDGDLNINKTEEKRLVYSPDVRSIIENLNDEPDEETQKFLDEL